MGNNQIEHNNEYYLEKKVSALLSLINDQFYSMIKFAYTLPFGGTKLMESMLRDLAKLHAEKSLAGACLSEHHPKISKNLTAINALKAIHKIHSMEKIADFDWLEINGDELFFTVKYKKDKCVYYTHCDELVCNNYDCICTRRFFYEGTIKAITGLNYRSEFNTPHLKDDFCSFSYKLITDSAALDETHSLEISRDSYHSEVIKMSKKVALSEIATNILHNVGNVLNSLNVSAFSLEENIKNSAVGDLNLLYELFDENKNNLSEYLQIDEKGKNILPYLKELSHDLKLDKKIQLSELQLLIERVDHIKSIIKIQSGYVDKNLSSKEIIKIKNIINPSISILQASLDNHSIKVEKEFADLEELLLDKGQLMQVFVNLISNAKYAMLENSNGKDRILTIKTEVIKDILNISFKDTGCGILNENFIKIFEHGYTTKADGNGFGLHSVGNIINSMGGQVSVKSDGINKGSEFIVKLPLENIKIK